MYPQKIKKALTPETKLRNKIKLRLLHNALDFLEAPQDSKTARFGSPTILYTQLLVGILIRGLSGYMKLPKSTRRAKALGIAVQSDFVPDRERKLQRKRLSRVERKLEHLRQSRDQEDDGKDLCQS